ncbi:MFS transporter [Herbiconiux sp. CPCC 203407]|uniref:MFS transporter n=1 Tax=Herbiconiux oxytropis TaxID=2970915 RepID=A0AA42BSS0_9MICO|nr:MFS transporter [Herbiconiux oxytropis]MCS5720611.1 MFS transporter [Herbiconiux oxytropis]MCS5725062.1 MFS transporter [Herbiconiux oxytropis]
MTSAVHPPRRATGVALVLLAIIATAINLRTAVTGFSPLLELIGDELGFGAALFGVFGTIVTASFAVFGLLTPIVARRVGLETMIAVATLLTTLGILLRAFSPNAAMLVFSTIVAFAGIGASNVLIVPIVKKYFPDRLKSVSSLYLSLLQLGQFVAPLIAVPVAVAAGWRFALGMWAVLTAVACVLWLVVVLRGRGPAAAAKSAASAPSSGRIAGAWRTPLVWSLVLMFGMTALNTYAVITWLPTIFVDAGADPALGGSLLALFSIFGLGAAFVVPPLTIRLRNPFPIVAVCAALLAVGYTGLLVAPLEGAVVWVVALGLGVSTFPMTLTLVNARTRTPAGSSMLSGATQGIGYAVACVGPFCIGLLYSASGGWESSYALLYTSIGVLVVSGFVACRPRPLEELAERAARPAAPAAATGAR